jgi:hypothetical protein
LGITPRRCSANSPSEAIPATVRRCAARLVSVLQHCAAHSRTADAPCPRKRTAEPSKGGTDAYSTLAQDYAVTSGQRDASPLSPSVLCGRPHPRNAIPSTAAPSLTLWGYGATRHRHDGRCAPYGLPSAAPSSQLTDNDSTEDFNTTTLEAAPGRTQGRPGRSAGSRIHQDGRPLRCTVCHAITRS